MYQNTKRTAQNGCYCPKSSAVAGTNTVTPDPFTDELQNYYNEREKERERSSINNRKMKSQSTCKNTNTQHTHTPSGSCPLHTKKDLNKLEECYWAKWKPSKTADMCKGTSMQTRFMEFTSPMEVPRFPYINSRTDYSPCQNCQRIIQEQLMQKPKCHQCCKTFINNQFSSTTDYSEARGPMDRFRLPACVRFPFRYDETSDCDCMTTAREGETTEVGYTEVGMAKDDAFAHTGNNGRSFQMGIQKEEKRTLDKGVGVCCPCDVGVKTDDDLTDTKPLYVNKSCFTGSSEILLLHEYPEEVPVRGSPRDSALAPGPSYNLTNNWSSDHDSYDGDSGGGVVEPIQYHSVQFDMEDECCGSSAVITPTQQSLSNSQSSNAQKSYPLSSNPNSVMHSACCECDLIKETHQPYQVPHEQKVSQQNEIQTQKVLHQVQNERQVSAQRQDEQMRVSQQSNPAAMLSHQQQENQRISHQRQEDSIRTSHPVHHDAKLSDQHQQRDDHRISHQNQRNQTRTSHQNHHDIKMSNQHHGDQRMSHQHPNDQRTSHQHQHDQTRISHQNHHDNQSSHPHPDDQRLHNHQTHNDVILPGQHQGDQRISQQTHHSVQRHSTSLSPRVSSPPLQQIHPKPLPYQREHNELYDTHIPCDSKTFVKPEAVVESIPKRESEQSKQSSLDPTKHNINNDPREQPTKILNDAEKENDKLICHCGSTDDLSTSSCITHTTELVNHMKRLSEYMPKGAKSLVKEMANIITSEPIQEIKRQAERILECALEAEAEKHRKSQSGKAKSKNEKSSIKGSPKLQSPRYSTPAPPRTSIPEELPNHSLLSVPKPPSVPQDNDGHNSTLAKCYCEEDLPGHLRAPPNSTRSPAVSLHTESAEINESILLQEQQRLKRQQEQLQVQEQLRKLQQQQQQQQLEEQRRLLEEQAKEIQRQRDIQKKQALLQQQEQQLKMQAQAQQARLQQLDAASLRLKLQQELAKEAVSAAAYGQALHVQRVDAPTKVIGRSQEKNPVPKKPLFSAAVARVTGVLRHSYPLGKGGKKTGCKGSGKHK